MGWWRNPESNGDTRIFSPLLYRLSYFAVPMVKPSLTLKQMKLFWSIVKESSEIFKVSLYTSKIFQMIFYWDKARADGF